MQGITLEQMAAANATPVVNPGLPNIPPGLQLTPEQIAWLNSNAPSAGGPGHVNPPDAPSPAVALAPDPTPAVAGKGKRGRKPKAQPEQVASPAEAAPTAPASPFQDVEDFISGLRAIAKKHGVQINITIL